MRLAWFLILSLFLVGALVPTALAHGYQIASVPAPNSRLTEPPSELHIVMSSPIKVDRSRGHVFDTNGDDHASGSLRAADNLTDSKDLRLAVSLPPGDGVYTVAWDALWISDGHRTQGGFAFVVGNGSFAQAIAIPTSSAYPPPPDAFFRGLGFVGWIAATGLLLFPALVGLPSWRSINAPPDVPWPGRTRIASLAIVGAVLALAAAVGSLIAEAVTVGGGLQGFAELLAGTSLGATLLTRAVLALLLAAGCLVALGLQRGSRYVAGLGLAGLATLSWVSHARSNGNAAVAVVDLVHLVAASLWVGMLLGTAATLPQTLRTVPSHVRGRYLGASISRVSLIAFASLLVLVATGTLNAIVQLERVSALWSTDYGRLLILKLLLVAVLFGLGALNRLFFVPAYKAGLAFVPTGGRSPRNFLRVVATELTVILLVLAATGVLAGTAPHPPIQAGTGYTATEDGENFHASLHLEPGALGVNEATVVLTPKSSTGSFDVTNVTIFAASPGGKLPRGESALAQDPSGEWRGNVTLGMPGDWLLTLYVQRSDAFDDAAEFPIRIPG